jgi:hypothetical protein
MKLSTTEKNLLIVILTIILTVLLSNLVYSRYLNKDGFFGFIIKIFQAIGKIFEFLGMIGDFFCWMGDAVQWMIDTIAALFYYIGNLFSGCVLFYAFDMFAGTMWYLLFILASMFGGGKEYTKGSSQVNDYRKTYDGYFYDLTGIHIFKYSDQTKEKCYKLEFQPFPKWPF